MLKNGKTRIWIHITEKTPDNTNPYMKGDKVTYQDKTYESIIDNNMWAPDVYGWKVVE